jgi:type VI secretion system protein ImpM
MVLPFKRAEAEAAGGYALYGKLPNRADFVRVNAYHPAVAEFDELIQRTLERLIARDGWAESYDRFGPVSFKLVSSDLRYTLIGVLAPSRDQAGRRYPLMAAAISPGDSIAGRASVAPIVHEVFFDGLRDQVRNAIENSVEALSCRQFLESQLHINNSAAADLELASSVVNRFMSTTPAARLQGVLMADGAGIRLEQALLNLAFYRAFLRRFDNVATNQIIVLPLPDANGEQALIACAWLSVIEALFGNDGSETGWCGNYAVLPTGPEKTVLITCFNKIHDKFAMMMLGGTPDPSVTLDLCHEYEAWKNHRLYSEVSYALARLLVDDALPIKDLCRFLQDVGQKLKETI